MMHGQRNIKKNTVFCIRCVGNILIVLDGHKTTQEKTLNYMNNVNKHIDFKLTCEENGKINFTHLLITRNKDTLAAVIFRNPTTTDITIHYIANRLIKHKLASCRFLLNKMHPRVFPRKYKKNTILHIAHNNGYTLSVITQLNNKSKTQNII
jgi:hypothetical protein